VTTTPDDVLRQVLTRKHVRYQPLLDRVTDYSQAKEMLADAMSRSDNHEGDQNAAD
jgi:hypothetical protein